MAPEVGVDVAVAKSRITSLRDMILMLAPGLRHFVP